MKIIYSILLFICSTFAGYGQDFDHYFIHKTLRVDYIFSGNSEHQHIFLDEISELPAWAGRTFKLSQLPLWGNGQVIMRDLDSGDCIYKTSFSSLFQEWIITEEAEKISRAFENTFLLPYPQKPVEIEIILFDSYFSVSASMKHIVTPGDILIHKKGENHISPHKYILKNEESGSSVNIAILAEGYTESEMDLFYEDAGIAVESILSHEPFSSMKDRLTFVAVASSSADSGVSVPGKGIWKNTAFNSHFDTFYSERYLTTNRVKAIHDALAGIPYEHIIILANTEEYGGGGIYNSFTLTTAHHPLFRPVVVHEFGHSFGGLGDEYFYENDVMNDMYPYNVEPWEQNITTLVDFESKWEDMLKKDTPVPTPVSTKENYQVGVYEGGGYSPKNIYRPAYNCRMRTNEYHEFCPVCQRSIKRVIDFYTTN